MPDKYNITKLIHTTNPNAIAAKLTFDGALPSVELRLGVKWLDNAMNEKIVGGATVSQTIADPWSLNISNEPVDLFEASLTV